MSDQARNRMTPDRNLMFDFVQHIKEPSWVIQYLGDRAEVVVPLKAFRLDYPFMSSEPPYEVYHHVDISRWEYTVWRVEEDGDHFRATLVVDMGRDMTSRMK